METSAMLGAMVRACPQPDLNPMGASLQGVAAVLWGICKGSAVGRQAVAGTDHASQGSIGARPFRGIDIAVAIRKT